MMEIDFLISIKKVLKHKRSVERSSHALVSKKSQVYFYTLANVFVLCKYDLAYVYISQVCLEYVAKVAFVKVVCIFVATAHQCMMMLWNISVCVPPPLLPMSGKKHV